MQRRICLDFRRWVGVDRDWPGKVKLREVAGGPPAVSAEFLVF